MTAIDDAPIDGLRKAWERSVLRLTLARPERRNALSRALVATLTDAFASVEDGGDTRAVVLTGDGPVFCAGADLTEFAEAGDPERLRADAEALSDLLAAMAACPVPIVAGVHGAAYGGGLGLVCAADIAVAAGGTQFSLSEARLGLVPATIGPYVVDALGAREAKARMLMAAPFGVDDAHRIGLVQRVVAPAELEGVVESVVDDVLHGAPGALAAIKRFVPEIAGKSAADVRERVMDLLVERRASAEGQEGMAAFLEKLPPSWVPSDAGSAE